MDARWDEFLLLPGDGMLLIHADGVVAFADRAASRLLGLETPVVGEPLVGWWPELARAISGRRPELDAHGPVDEEIAWRGASQTVRLFRTDTGVGVGVLAEAATRQTIGPSRILYSRVMQAMAEAVLVTTAEPFESPGQVIVFANDRFLDETGYSRVEVIGRSPRIGQGPGTTDQAKAQFREAFSKWHAGSVEVLNYRKDGTPFWTEIRFAPVADETGWFTHWVSVGSNITERREAEERDRRQQAMVQSVLDAMPSASVLIDGEGAIVAANAAWRAIGATRLGENYLESCRQSDTEVTLHPFATVAADAIAGLLEGEPGPVIREYSWLSTEGPRRYRLVGLPLSEGHGAVLSHHDLANVSSDGSGAHGGDSSVALSRDDVLAAVTDWHARRGISEGSSVAVIVVSMDNLIDVVDAFGSAQADQLWTTMTRRLSQFLGSEAFTAAVEGEASIAVLPVPTSTDGLERLLEPLCSHLGQAVQLDLGVYRPSVSCGVARGQVARELLPELLDDAVVAMRAARRGGSGGWREFTPADREEAHHRISSNVLVSSALDREGFELLFQPVVDLHTGRNRGSEALLRIRDEHGDLVAPARFLAGLETGPHVEEVGWWVLNRSLEVQAGWQRRAGHESHRMAINVSPRQLGHGRFLEAIKEGLARHNVPPGNLMVEVLEDAIVRAGDQVESELRDISALGVGVAIDDFGTGYSAMSYLQNFPVSTVKIDRSFIVASHTIRGLRLLRAAGEVARAVDASVVAEGIETMDQLRAAQVAGVDYGQGYLFGRPEPAGDVPVSFEILTQT